MHDLFFIERNIATLTALTVFLLFATVLQPVRLNAQRTVDREYKVVLISEPGTEAGVKRIEMQVNEAAKGGWRLVATPHDAFYVFERSGN